MADQLLVLVASVAATFEAVGCLLVSTVASRDEVLTLVENLLQMRAPPVMVACSNQYLLVKTVPDDEALEIVAFAQNFAT